MRLCSILKTTAIGNRKFPQASLAAPRRWATVDEAYYSRPDVFFSHELSAVTTAQGWVPGGLPMPASGVVRVLIFNGTGTGYGDLLCGTVAIRLLHEGIIRAGYTPRLEIIHAPSHERQYREVYGSNPFVADLVSGAVVCEEMDRSHYIASTEQLLADQKFNELDMIDYFIWRLGMDYEKVPAAEKLPILPHTPETVRGAETAFRLKKRGEKVCLLNLHASGFRRLSAGIWGPLIQEIHRAGYRLWLTGAPHRAVDLEIAFKELGLARIGAVNVLAATPTWLDSVGLIQNVDAVITPDTSVVHVAGAARVPCVGLFLSIDPKLRISYYPTVRGYVRPEWKKTAWWGKSVMPPEIMKEPYEQNTEWVEAWAKVNAAGVVKLLGRVADA
jgi:hypothetical protein